MSKREDADREQPYHELLNDARELLLLQNLLPLPIKVHPFFAIIFGAIEACVADLAGRVQVDTPATQLALAQLRRGDKDEINWRALHALVTDLAGRLQADTRLAHRRLADLDHRAAFAVSALRDTFALALDAARTLAATDRHDPSWWRAYRASGTLLTAFHDRSTKLMRIIGDRAVAGSVRRPVATRPPSYQQPIASWPLPAPSVTGSMFGASIRGVASSPPGHGYSNPGSFGGLSR
jgi:hypothetical protein